MKFEFFMEHPVMFGFIISILKAIISWLITSIAMSIFFHVYGKKENINISYWDKLKISFMALKYLFIAEICINFFFFIGPLPRLIIEILTLYLANIYLSNKFINEFKISQENAKKLAKNIILTTILGLFTFAIILLVSWTYWINRGDIIFLQ